MPAARVVYEFPANWPFTVRLQRPLFRHYASKTVPLYQLVRQGLSAGEVELAPMTRADLQRLHEALLIELRST